MQVALGSGAHPVCRVPWFDAKVVDSLRGYRRTAEGTGWSFAGLRLFTSGTWSSETPAHFGHIDRRIDRRRPRAVRRYGRGQS